MSFRARLAFELEISHEVAGVSLPTDIVAMDQPVWTLKQIEPRTELRGQRLDLRSQSVSDEAEAKLLGQRAIASLMVIALRKGFGITLSERLPTGTVFNAGRRLLAGDKWDALLDDLLGLTVYEDVGRVGFIGVGPIRLQAGITALAFTEAWSNVYGSATPPSEAVLTSFDLWASSRSESSSRARFLLLVMAIEALVTPAARPDSEQLVVKALLESVENSSLEDEAKNRLLNAVRGLMMESIGRSCRTAIEQAFGADEAKGFGSAYKFRNIIAHGGTPPSARALVEQANGLEPMVTSLLLRALGADST